jgi:hypothetical protein
MWLIVGIEEEGLKTENSARKVPIPEMTLEALNEYIEENKITDYLFYSGSKTIHYNMFGFASKQFGAHCGYTEKELKEKIFRFYSLRHFYITMLERSSIKSDIIKYFSGHSVNIHNMNENYNNKEDLDDIFYEESGLQVIKYVNDLCQKVKDRYELMPIHTHIEQVALTDNKNKVNTYFADVLNDIDFENETHLYLCDLQDKNLLDNADDKNELINGLKKLLASETIDKRRYDDCIDYLTYTFKSNTDK